MNHSLVISEHLIINKEAYIVLSQKIYRLLYHTHSAAFAVHRHPSQMFGQWGDQSELRGATPNFWPRLSPKPMRDWLPADFTVHSEKRRFSLRIMLSPFSYFYQLLPYTRIASVQGGNALGGIPSVMPAAIPTSLRVLPASWQASIAAFGRDVPF